MIVNDLVNIDGQMCVIEREATPEEIAEIERQEQEQSQAFWKLPYADRVSKLIRERYSLDDELALSRQRDTKQEEFEEYFAFCEECKVRAKAEAEE